MLGFNLTACAGTAESDSSEITEAETDEQEYESDDTENSSVAESESDNGQENNNTLVVFYSYSGTTAEIAELIQEKTDADIYEIMVSEPYPASSSETSDRAAEERESGNLPVLSEEIPSIEDYDTVLIGGPVWTHTVSTPIMSYLEQVDFQGKTVAPFWTDAGTPGDYETDFSSQVQNGEVQKGLGLSNASSYEENELSIVLDEWLTEIGVSLLMEEKELSLENTIGENTDVVELRMTAGEVVITAEVDQSETTQAFLATLPRTLEMNRYGDREYYGRIESIVESGETIEDYENGDVTYYPGGPSFAVFFGDAENSDQGGLIRMGRITSDLTLFEQLGDTEEILIEIVE